jgi:hypothetical protein
MHSFVFFLVVDSRLTIICSVFLLFLLLQSMTHSCRCQLYYCFTCSDWLQYYDQAALYYTGLANHETNPLLRALYHEQVSFVSFRGV